MSGPEVADNPGAPASWFVEDINLTNTTLRFARTNEVCSISNASISASRIVNCNRSPNAIVLFPCMCHISILKDGKLEKFKQKLQEYVDENPRIWDSIAFVRKDNIDSDMEQANFSLAFRHRNSWQDAGRIFLNRGDLVEFVYMVLKSLGVNYDTPPARRLLYSGGVLEQGQVQDYKVNLLNPKNIRSHSARFDRERFFETGYPDSILGEVVPKPLSERSTSETHPLQGS